MMHDEKSASLLVPVANLHFQLSWYNQISFDYLSLLEQYRGLREIIEIIGIESWTLFQIHLMLTWLQMSWRSWKKERVYR